MLSVQFRASLGTMIHKKIFCEDKLFFDKSFNLNYSMKLLNFISKMNANFTFLEISFFSQNVTASKYP